MGMKEANTIRREINAFLRLARLKLQKWTSSESSIVKSLARRVHNHCALN